MVDSFNAQAPTDMELDTSVYTSVNTFLCRTLPYILKMLIIFYAYTNPVKLLQDCKKQ